MITGGDALPKHVLNMNSSVPILILCVDVTEIRPNIHLTCCLSWPKDSYKRFTSHEYYLVVKSINMNLKKYQKAHDSKSDRLCFKFGFLTDTGRRLWFDAGSSLDVAVGAEATTRGRLHPSSLWDCSTWLERICDSHFQEHYIIIV